MNRRRFSPIAILALVTQAGCGSHDQDASKPKIPVDVSYTVIKDEHDNFPPNKKRYVDFRVNRKVSKEVLREIALEVKAKEPQPYERTISFYHLPVLVQGAPDQPWARSDYRPTLEIEIIGVTIEDEAKLRALKIETSGQRIGSWLIEMLGGYIAVIYKDVDGLKLAEVGGAKNRRDQELVELPSRYGRRFMKKNGHEIYEIDPSGVLRLYGTDDGKVFAGAVPLK